MYYMCMQMCMYTCLCAGIAHEEATTQPDENFPPDN